MALEWSVGRGMAVRLRGCLAHREKAEGDGGWVRRIYLQYLYYDKNVLAGRTKTGGTVRHPF